MPWHIAGDEYLTYDELELFVEHADARMKARRQQARRQPSRTPRRGRR